MQHLPRSVWILSTGRFLSEIGTGFTFFYGPIVFVNQIGLSATDVGVALGASSIVGIFARILSGSLCDSRWGAKRTLLLSGIVSAIGSFLLVMTQDFPSLLLGNVFAGAGIGFYWPASEATIASTTPFSQHRDAYTLARFADNLGMGIGIIAGSALITVENAYRYLFAIDGISYLIFAIVAALALPHIARLRRDDTDEKADRPVARWFRALRDRTLLLYLAINVCFTVYIAHTQAVLPLYLTNIVTATSGIDLPPEAFGALFTSHIILSAVLQIPVSRALGSLSHVRALGLSAGVWCVGFIGIWGLSVLQVSPLIIGIVSLSVFALAIVAYTPSASAFVALMAPDELRGIYLSMNSLCWAVGYSVGPPLGGMALDAGAPFAIGYWLLVALSSVAAIAALYALGRLFNRSQRRHDPSDVAIAVNGEGESGRKSDAAPQYASSKVASQSGHKPKARIR